MIAGAKILIVDDHASVRDGLRAFFESKTDFIVCGEADTGVAAIKKSKELNPDVIIMDLALPMLNGVEAASVIKGELPCVKIVAFSMYGNDLGRAVKSASRIDAVLPKSSNLAVLVETIQKLLGILTPRPSQPGTPQSCPPA